MGMLEELGRREEVGLCVGMGIGNWCDEVPFAGMLRCGPAIARGRRGGACPIHGRIFGVGLLGERLVALPPYSLSTDPEQE